MTFLLAPTPASAEENPIKLTSDGKHIIMPVEVFKNREIDLLRLEAKVQALQKALKEERDTTDEYLAKMKQLEQAINEERKSYQNYTMSTAVKWGAMGLALGVIIGVMVD